MNVHLIGMMKMSKAKYDYKGKFYSAEDLLKKGKREIGVKRCHKLKASYLVMQVYFTRDKLVCFSNQRIEISM